MTIRSAPLIRFCLFMALLAAFSIFGVTAQAEEITHGQHLGHGQHQRGKNGGETAPSPYVGQQHRAIKSLSDDDIAELQKGGGWGLAKAAELNGLPGPAHLLELSDLIPLSDDQHAAIAALFATMQQSAILEGEKLIAAEAALDDAFKAGNVNEDELKSMLDEIAQSRSRLRFIHLSTHLKTPDILSPAQIARYNSLRGYGD
ncbi:MAG: Spy/CpxP family protein refolding chaperone [Thalassospira sp.]|uniref:Spy/CpxP family protein refolding chaperone n=1 Tax=Thalassospira sp. TaxID=1912094 RepID=UPI003A841DE6